MALRRLKRWVVKAGSKMVCEGGAPLMQAWMQQVVALREQHRIEVIWVSSGAIAWAVQSTSLKVTKSNLPQKQALSAIGQPLIMAQYSAALAGTGLRASQVLLSTGDIQDRSRRQNLSNTLNALLKWNVLPILNENDAVATEEIRFGDNDSLASQVAVMMKAERLVLLTDVDGLFDGDPKKNPEAPLIRYRKRIGPAELKMVDRKTKSAQGTGGMYSKLLAADRAGRAGIITHLVRGDHANNLLELAVGHKMGTQIGGKA